MYARFKFEDNSLDGTYYKVVSVDNHNITCEIYDSSEGAGIFTTLTNQLNYYHLKLRKNLTFKDKFIGMLHFPLILGYRLTINRFPKIASKFRHRYIKTEIKYLGV